MAHPASTHPSTAAGVIGEVRKGLPTGRLDKMAQMLDVDRALLLGVLGISGRTVQRKHSQAERLSPVASDRLSRIGRIYALAAEVLGSNEKAAAWLKRPSRALGSEWPLRLLDTDAGTQQVERELRQVEHGFVY
jgi:putative toxin-antitoxin system antitoxin component (TIGR02293 family)